MNKEERWVLLTACVPVWLLLGQNVFLLVALGAGYRLFTKDVPQQPNWAITAYFVAWWSHLAS